MDVTSLYNRRADDRWNRVAVGDILERLTWSQPDREAIVAQPGAFSDERFERLTYRAANDIANQIGNALLAAGLQRGDRLLMLCDNSAEGLLLKYGAAKVGVAAAPLNPHMAVDVLAQLITQIEPRFTVVDDVLWEAGREAFEQTGTRVDVTISLSGEVIEGSKGLVDWIDAQPMTEPDVRVHGDDIYELVFSSGTTALPKAVMISHTYVYMAAYSFALPLGRGIPESQDIRLVTFLPVVFHGGHVASIESVFLAGGTVVLGRRHDPKGIVKAFTDEKVNALWGGSPQLIGSIVAEAEADPTVDFSTLQNVIFAWRAIDPTLRARLIALAGHPVRLIEILAQTEALTGVRFAVEREEEKFLATAPQVNTVGLPNPITAADIVDADGNSLRGKPGVPGEVVYRSPAVMAGYYRDEETTAEALRGGWFHSGDSCMYDEDGLFVMVDRFKDIVKSGGENVSSLRVETVVMQHPDVDRAAVIGVHDERWGEIVTAVVVPVAGVELTAEDVITFCRGRLAGFETPKRVVFQESLPETVGGKIRKHVLRAEVSGI